MKTYPLLLLLLACGGNPSTPGTPDYTDTVTVLRTAIAESMSLPADSIAFEDSSFVIERDGTISYADALERFKPLLSGDKQGQATGTTQMFGYYKINTDQYRIIKVYADATVPAMWLTALDSAITHSNGIGHGIRYARQAVSTGSTTRITTNNIASSTIASAAYPDYYGRPGSRITINRYQDGLPESKKVHALVHELAHTIGFSHTNGTYGTLVTETGGVDAASVMNSTVRYWQGFSTYDTVAFKKIYPSY